MFKSNSASFGGTYLFCFIGAAIYFIGQSADFWGGVVGFFKALVWPAVLIFEVLSALGA